MNQNDKNSNWRGVISLLCWAALLTIVISYASNYLGSAASHNGSVEIRYSEFVELLEDGWLAVTLEAVLPRRGDSDRSRFLAHSLRAAIRRAFPDRLPPKFHICVLAYEHIYGPGRRFLDHDNLELKHCQDVLEAAFLTNDTSALCSAFQCSHRGERNATRIWVLPAEAFPKWLESHRESWAEPPEI